MILGNWTAAGWPQQATTPRPPAPKPVDLKKRYVWAVDTVIYTPGFRIPRCPTFKENTNG